MKKAFTLVELTLILGILGIILGFTIINVSTVQTKTDLANEVTTVLSDIKTQQLKAMNGDAEGRTTADNYGVHFDIARKQYALFHGTYAYGNASNFVVNLDKSLDFPTVSLPNSEIIFSQGTGEVVGFNGSQNTFVIRDTADGQQKTVTINKLGVITNVN